MGVPIWKKPTSEPSVCKKRSRRREADLDQSLQGSLLRRVLPLLRADDAIEDDEVSAMHHSGNGSILSSRDPSGLWSFRTGGSNLQRRSSIHGRRDRIRQSLSPRSTVDTGNIANWSGWDTSLDLAEFVDGTGTAASRRRERQDSQGSNSSSSSSSSHFAGNSADIHWTPSELERFDFDRINSSDFQRAIPRSDQSRYHPQLHRTRSSSNLSAQYNANAPSSLPRSNINNRRNSLRRPQVHFTVPVADSIEHLVEDTELQPPGSLLTNDGHDYETDAFYPYRRASSFQNDSTRRQAAILESEERRWASRRLNTTIPMSHSTLPDDNCPRNTDGGS